MQIDLSVKELTRKFGEFTAVDRVSFNVESGKFFSILGPSGCGKTTLLRMIAGFYEPTSGAIEIRGQDMAGHVGMAAKLFTALAEAGVNIRVIDQGSSENNIIIGVEGTDLEKAVAAIYHAFCE